MYDISSFSTGRSWKPAITTCLAGHESRTYINEALILNTSFFFSTHCYECKCTTNLNFAAYFSYYSNAVDFVCQFLYNSIQISKGYVNITIKETLIFHSKNIFIKVNQIFGKWTLPSLKNIFLYFREHKAYWIFILFKMYLLNCNRAIFWVCGSKLENY